MILVVTDTFMNESTAEFVGTCDRLRSIASASLTQIVLSSCCVHVQVVWAST